MGNRNIHIDNLQIRIPRSLSGSARQIADGLGREILRSVAETTREQRGTLRIEEVSGGKVKVSGTGDIQTLRDRIGREVAAELAGKINSKEVGK